MSASLQQWLGSLLGQAVGDAVCAPFEGVPPDAIYYGFGTAAKILRDPPVEVLRYTDDTQMMIAVGETLVECGGIEERELCESFVRVYEPNRGYGPGARRVIGAMAAGEDWRAVAETVYPGGSLGNGAAMRAAPIGLAFADDLDAAWAQAERASLPTHVHLIGIEGGQLVAAAVALASRGGDVDAAPFAAELLRRVRTGPFHERLTWLKSLGPGDSIACLGNGIKAHESVATAIACFLQSPDSYERTVGAALSLGGDCDTIAAIAGAISGARLGVTAIPGHLLQRLENGERGRDYISTLAGRLFARFSTAAA